MSDTPLLDWVAPKRMRFDGPEYEPTQDRDRLSEQHVRIRELMLDGQWRTVAEISSRTSDPEPSVSAQLRHLRKQRFGAFVVERRKRGDRARGLFEYRVLPPDPLVVREHGSDSKAVIAALRKENAELLARIAELEASR